MADIAHLLIQPLPNSAQPGAILLEVLEAAQRLVAYADNHAVGATEDAELASLGLPTRKLERAMHDLRRSVQQMNATMATEEGCRMLAGLRPALPRLVA